MALIRQESGCKVGWKWFDTEAEALAESEFQHGERERKFAQGYDFGWQWPSAVKKLHDHPDFPGKDIWIVVTV